MGLVGGGGATNELPDVIEDTYSRLAYWAGLADAKERGLVQRPFGHGPLPPGIPSGGEEERVYREQNLLVQAFQNNPYVSIPVPFEPDESLQLAEDEVAEFSAQVDRYLGGIERGVEDVWEGRVSTVKSKLDTLGDYFAPSYIPPQDLAVASRAISSVIITQALSTVSEAAPSIIDDAVSKASENVDSIVSNADGLVKRLLALQMASGDDKAYNITDTRVGSILNNARRYAAEALGSAQSSEGASVAVDLAVTAMTTAVGDALSAAIASAVEAIDNDILVPAVTEYENRQTFGHMRGLNRFTGPMVDINAVVGSAFVMGLANAENELQIDIRKYDADLSMRLFQLALPVFMDTFAKALAISMDVYSRELVAFLDSYKTATNSQIQSFLTLLPQYLNTYLGMLPQYLSQHTSIEKGYEGVAQGVFSDSMRNLAASFLGYLQSATSIKTAREGAQDQFLLTGTQQAMNSLFQSMDVFKNRALMYHQFSQLAIEAENDYHDNQSKFSYASRHWDLDVLQTGANIIASPSGAAVLEPGPSGGQRVASGAFAGGALAASLLPEGTAALGAVGLPVIGAGIGLGALLGLLG